MATKHITKQLWGKVAALPLTQSVHNAWGKSQALTTFLKLRRVGTCHILGWGGIVPETRCNHTKKACCLSLIKWQDLKERTWSMTSL